MNYRTKLQELLAELEAAQKRNSGSNADMNSAVSLFLLKERRKVLEALRRSEIV